MKKGKYAKVEDELENGHVLDMMDEKPMLIDNLEDGYENKYSLHFLSSLTTTSFTFKKVLLCIFIYFILFFTPFVWGVYKITDSNKIGNNLYSSYSSYEVVENSFFDILWKPKVDNNDYQMAWKVPKTLLNRLFLIDILYASSTYIDGTQQNSRHMPRVETEYNVFSLRYSKSKQKLELYKPLLSINTNNNNNIYTGYVSSLSILSETNNNILIDVSSLFKKGFSLVDISNLVPKANLENIIIEVKDVKGYNKNFNININMIDIFTTDTIFEDLSYTFVLLDKKPKISRIHYDLFGYFTSQFITIGINNFTKSIFMNGNNNKISRETIDSKINIINRVYIEKNSKIIYYIDPSIPKKYQIYVKKGVEEWNKAFKFAGYNDNIIYAILPNDINFPKDYSAGDIRYNSISWSLDLKNTFALGPSSIDPRSGEILNADIVFTNGWLKSWFGNFFYSKLIQNILFKYDENIIDSLFGYGIMSVTLHEVGHTLGLRHNFKGSNNLPFKGLKEAIEKGKDLSSTVMDYLPMVIFQNMTIEEQVKHAFLTNIGLYDKLAIAYGYKELVDKSVVYTDSYHTVEVPMDSSTFVNWFNENDIKKIDFATDEDLNKNDFNTKPFDLTSEPYLYYISNLENIKEIRKQLNKNKNNNIKLEERYFIEIDIINEVYITSERLMTLLSSKIYPTRNTNINTNSIKYITVSKTDIFYLILETVLNIVNYNGLELIDLKAVNKVLKPIGKCYGLETYCEGKEYLDIPSFITKIRKYIISTLLSPTTLKNIDFRIQIGNDNIDLFDTYFQLITSSIFGENILESSYNVELNQTTYTISKEIEDPTVWYLQLDYVDNLAKVAYFNLKADIFGLDSSFINSYISTSARQEIGRIFNILSILSESNIPENIKAHISILSKLMTYE